MAILRKDLQAVKSGIKALEKKVEELLKAHASMPKAKKVTKKRAVKKAKSVKKASAKKAPAKKAVAKKKAVTKKKAAQLTATDMILQIVKRSKKGVDVPTLKKKSGFDDKKVRNIVFRASKEGKIKKSGRGMYIGA